MLIFIGVTSRGSSDFILYFVRFLKLFWISLSAKYTDGMFLAPHGSCVNPLGIARGQSHSINFIGTSN